MRFTWRGIFQIDDVIVIIVACFNFFIWNQILFFFSLGRSTPDDKVSLQNTSETIPWGLHFIVVTAIFTK